jgi:hypothetical protein
VYVPPSVMFLLIYSTRCHSLLLCIYGVRFPFIVSSIVYQPSHSSPSSCLFIFLSLLHNTKGGRAYPPMPTHQQASSPEVLWHLRLSIQRDKASIRGHISYINELKRAFKRAKSARNKGWAKRLRCNIKNAFIDLIEMKECLRSSIADLDLRTRTG